MNRATTVSWTDEADSSQCDVPRTPLPSNAVPGCLSALALFVASGPFILSAFFLFSATEAERQSVEFAWTIVVFFAFWGLFAFPLALWMLGKGVLLLWGRTTILVDAQWLRVTTRAGPFWSTRRCRLARLHGFQIETPQGDGIGFPGGHSNLTAVHEDGRTIPLLRMREDGIIRELTEALPNKIGRLARGKHSGTGHASRLHVEVISLDPLASQERKNKPLGSGLFLDEQPDELVINVPRLGFRGSTSPLFRFWVIGFFVMQLVIMTSLVPALIAGKVQGQPSAGWVIVCVFSAVFIGILANRFNAATRRGSVHIAGGYLRFRERDVWGKHFAGWTWESVENVRVGVKQYKTDGGISWNHYVEVQPGPASRRQWFDNRSKPELEWIVTCIVDHMNRYREREADASPET